MFLNDPKAIDAAVSVIKHTQSQMFPGNQALEGLFLIPLADEVMRHMDNLDECSVTIHMSKEHGIQTGYTGCPLHAQFLAVFGSLAQLRATAKTKAFADLSKQESTAIQLLLAQLAVLADSIINKKEDEKEG